MQIPLRAFGCAHRGSAFHAVGAPRLAMRSRAVHSRQDTISAAALCIPLCGWFAIANCIPVLAFRCLPSPIHVVPVAPWIPRLRDKASAVTHSPRHTSPPRNHRRQDVLPAMIKLDSPGFGWIYPDSALLTQADPRFPPPVSASPRAHVSREQVGSGRMRNATAFPEPSRSADRMEAGASIYLDSAFLPQAGPRFPTTRAPFVMSASLTRTAWIWLDLPGSP